jgi:integrase
MGLYVRGMRLWHGYRDEDGKWRQARTPYMVGQEREAERYHRAFQRGIDERRAAGLAGPLTLAAYAERWWKEREALGLASAADDKQRIRDHVLPTIGHLLLDEVRARHVKDLVTDMRKGGVLAPRTIRNVYSALSTLYKHAVVDDLVAASPCALPRGIVPGVEDKDPGFRLRAVFSQDELVQLVTSPRLLMDRRVVYALKGLAGMRHGEVAQLRWDHVSRARPLDCIDLMRTKTKMPRRVPVHPALRQMLVAWRGKGWAAVYGRKPGPGDLVVPTRYGNQRSAPEAQEAFLADLATLGLRPRRGHDLRRTFITLARAHGARDEMLKLVSHGPSKKMLDQYTTMPWAPLCEVLLVLKVRLRGDIMARAERVRRAGAFATQPSADD